jgi:tetratricopeptide (TPR) repeat protein
MNSLRLLPLLVCLAAFLPAFLNGADVILELQQKMDQARQRDDPAEIVKTGQRLAPLLEEKGNLQQATEAALAVAFAADRIGTRDDAIAAAANAARLVAASRLNAMRPWDYMLQSQMAGIGVKNLLAAGRQASAATLQADAWRFIAEAVRMETGRPWKPGDPVPAELSPNTLGIVLRTARYDFKMLCSTGRNVLAVEQMRSLEAGLRKARAQDGLYRGQILGDLANELKFLGYWRDCTSLLDEIVERFPDTSTFTIKDAARFNKAYWSAEVEGPDPKFLAAAQEAGGTPNPLDGTPVNRMRRRLLAKMAFAYREAGVEVGELEKLIKEAQADGDKLEAIYTRRDLAVIQSRKRDFAEAEKNLLTTLAALRAVGQKSGEPYIYREYGVLLAESGRPREAIQMLREAIRLTKSYQWTQHLPPLLSALAETQATAGDAEGLRATLAELEKLLAEGKLEPQRKLSALVAKAICLKALGDAAQAKATLDLAVKNARSDGLNEWQVEWAEKLPLAEIKLAAPPNAVAKISADLQPLQITSAVLPDEQARVRYTLSNPAATPVRGTFEITGSSLDAAWHIESGTALLRMGAKGGVPSIRQEISLKGGEEFLLVCDADGGSEVQQLKLRWATASAPPQESSWKVLRAEPDGLDVAVTNASLASRNPFYALRLHHALSRRGGEEGDPVDFRVKASQPVRIELLHAATGDLIAVDARGDGELKDAGDMIISDANRNGIADLAIPTRGPVEFAVLVYPLPDAKPQATKEDIVLDVQIKDATGWQSAAKDILKQSPR